MDTIDPLMTIAAPAGISGSAFCTVKSVPLTLIPKYLSKCASVTCPSGTNSPAPGVGEEDVEAALLLFDRVEEAVQVGEVADIAANGGDVAANLLYSSVKFRLTAAGDEDIGAFRDESFCRGQADAAAAAGDEGDFS